MPLTLTTGLNLGGSNRGGLRLSPVTGFSAPAIKHNPAATVTLDAAAKVTPNGANTTTTVASDYPGQTNHVTLAAISTSGVSWNIALPSAWDLTNAYVRLTLRINGLPANEMKTFQIRAGTSAAALTAGNYHQYTARAYSAGTGTTANWITANTWTYEAFVPGTAAVVGTGATLSNINALRLVFATNTTAGITVDAAKVELVPNASTKAKCVIWHDDTFTGVGGANAIATRMAAYGFPWTEATQWEQIDTNGYITAAQALIYQAAGIQFGSHSTTNAEHKQDTVPNLLDQATRNVAAVKRLGLSLRGGADMAWWGGQSITSTYYDAIKSKYRSGRYNTSGMQVPEVLPPANPWAYKAFLVGTAHTHAANFQPYLEAAVACKGLATFVYHQDVGSDAGATTEFETLLAYLDANRATIDVVTINDALASSTL